MGGRMTDMTLNEVMRRLAEGICPSPPEIELIVEDIRRQRAAYAKGGKAKSVNDDALAEVRAVMNAGKPPKETIRRRI